MTTAKHTPGPWLRDKNSGVRCDVRAESGRKVALCWGLSSSMAARENRQSYRDECNANARLIAAAPDLLEALKGAIGALEFSRDYHADLSNAEQAFAQDRLDAALAAIAKAEGAS